ncbi:substrate-binding domain-containing protein [Vibrio gigantis]|uniref:substrate-binding domain-containing protein n=1 Tax=Vibrio gigantis TaxID=296199 RepID=UPI001BFD71B9
MKPAIGLKIPEDLSIVGFDDVMEQHYFSTKLTTVKCPIEDMADSAARLAINNQDSTAKKKVCFFPVLIWRKSIGNYVRQYLSLFNN